MKKIIAIIISFCIIFTNFNSIYANSNSDLELIGVLKDADKIQLVQNDYNFGEAYAVFGDLKNTVRWNKNTNEVNFKVENIKTRSLLENSTFNMEINENFEPSGLIEYDGEKYSLETTDANTSNARFVIGLPAIIGSALVSALIAASASIIIYGVRYFLKAEIESALRKKKYKHYQAAVRYSEKLKRYDLFIGDALGETGASGRMKAGNDVWSTSKTGASNIARLAGGGKNPVGAEKHGGGKPGYYWHYHTYNRKGGHSFY